MNTRYPRRSPAMRLLLLAVLAVLPALCGCTDVARIFSEPSGAQLLVNGRERGTTPAAVMVNRSRKRISVELRHPDCRPLVELLRREWDGRPVPWQHFRLEPVGKGTVPAEDSGECALTTPAGALQEREVP